MDELPSTSTNAMHIQTHNAHIACTHIHTSKSVWLLCPDNPNIGDRYFALLEDLEKWFSIHSLPSPPNLLPNFYLCLDCQEIFDNIWRLLTFWERGKVGTVSHYRTDLLKMMRDGETLPAALANIITPAFLTLVLLTLSRKRGDHMPHVNTLLGKANFSRVLRLPVTQEALHVMWVAASSPWFQNFPTCWGWHSSLNLSFEESDLWGLPSITSNTMYPSNTLLTYSPNTPVLYTHNALLWPLPDTQTPRRLSEVIWVIVTDMANHKCKL